MSRIKYSVTVALLFMLISEIYTEGQLVDEIPPPIPPPTSIWEATLFLQLEDGIWLQSFFGYFRIDALDYQESRWIYHQHHGWVWIEKPTLDNLWMLFDGVGWCYSTIELYPLVYSTELGWMYYLKGTADPQWFYNYRNSEWIYNLLDYSVNEIYFKRVTAPVELRIEEPDYPDDLVPATEDDEKGRFVSVMFIVDREGDVENAAVPIWYHPWIVDRPDLKIAVVRAIEQSVFKPSTVRGEVVKTWHYHKYFFKLKDSNDPPVVE